MRIFLSIVFWQWFKPQVLETSVRELTVDCQVLRQVHIDLLYGSPVVGFFLLIAGFDEVWFRYGWMLVFWIFIAWCGENCSTCATPCRSVNFCYTWATPLCYSRVGEFCSPCANPFRSVNFCCTWATPECSLGIMFLLDSVELGIWAILSLLWLCLFKAVYCTWLSIVYSHLFFLVIGFYLVFRYSRHVWAGVAYLLFTRHTTHYIEDSHS
jgi:hypothetical protein